MATCTNESTVFWDILKEAEEKNQSKSVVATLLLIEDTPLATTIMAYQYDSLLKISKIRLWLTSTRVVDSQRQLCASATLVRC